MKKYLFLFLLFILLIVIIIVIFKLKNSNKKEINSIKSLSYEYGDGRSIYGKVKYNITCDNKCILSSKLSGYHDEDIISVEIDKETMDKILDILIKYNVSSWDGFKKSNLSYKDGKNYEFRVETLDNQKISAQGYMAYPKNYKEVINSLEEIFKKINDSTFTYLFNHDYYKNFDINKVIKLEIDTVTEAGIDTNEITNKNEINDVYMKLKKIKVGINSNFLCDDNSIIYRFIMSDGTNYKVEKNCDWIVIDDKSYYYEGKF